MGLVISTASADSAPPPLPNFTNIGQAAAAAIKAEKPSYLELPAPVKYEEIQREALMALKPDLFEGLRFEINKPLNPNFFLSHSLFMGNMDLSTGGRQALKTPIGNYGACAAANLHARMLCVCLYRASLCLKSTARKSVCVRAYVCAEFGANVINEHFMMLGRVTTDGRLSGRMKYDVTNWLSAKLHMQLANEPGQSQGMFDADLKGGDWNAQVKLGSPAFLGLNYFQSITPRLSAGGEFFWLHNNLKSGVGAALRHQGDRHVATLQVRTLHKSQPCGPRCAVKNSVSLQASPHPAHNLAGRKCFCAPGILAGQCSERIHMCLCVRVCVCVCVCVCVPGCGAGGHNRHPFDAVRTQGQRKDHARGGPPLALDAARRDRNSRVRRTAASV